ncbi:MAG: hypothetical protein HWE27_04395 [Gammaproteobacteria bacterium]|nr:hypothetical protein [Gammaproteobacteria bacterium]
MLRIKRRVLSISSILPILILSGCSSEFLRAMDDALVAQGGQGTCRYEAPKRTINGSGYTFTYGGYCNYWEGELNNYSQYTIRCTGKGYNGRAVSSVTARPGVNTDTRTMGSMQSTGGGLSVECNRWARSEYVAKSSKGLVLYEKMVSGKLYNRVKNDSRFERECFIKRPKSTGYILKERVQPYGVTGWRSVAGEFNYGCRRV